VTTPHDASHRDAAFCESRDDRPGSFTPQFDCRDRTDSLAGRCGLGSPLLRVLGKLRNVFRPLVFGRRVDLDRLSGGGIAISAPATEGNGPQGENNKGQPDMDNSDAATQDDLRSEK
jgi:hypothetical protein